MQYITKREFCGSIPIDVYREVFKRLVGYDTDIRESTINLIIVLLRNRVLLTCRHLITNTVDHTKRSINAISKRT
jgi:hypothetical protein